MTNTVTFPPAVGGDGSTVTDDSSATTGLANGGFRARLVPMFTQIVNIANWILGKANAAATSAANAATSETNAGNSAAAAGNSATNSAASAAAASGSATAAANSATSAQNYAAALLGTSTSAVAVGTGPKTFTTQAGKQFAVGQFVSIVSAGAPANYMHGQVTAYSSTSLTVNVLDVGGSGSPADWNISVSGTQGQQGAQGSQGAQGTPGTLSGTATGAIDELKGANIASAATVNLEAATGNLIHITGTTAITAITLNSGAERTVVFDGVLTLTYNAASLILPGGANITTAAGDAMIVRGDGAGNARVIDYVRANGAPVFSPDFPYIRAIDQRASGTNGGTSAVGMQTRVLNTVVANTITGASLASNQITLPAGTYRVRGTAPLSYLNHQASLYNVTDSTTLVVGSSEYGPTDGTTITRSAVVGSFVLATAKALSVRHYTSNSGDSLGMPSSSGLGEVYTEVEIWKVA